MSSKREEQPLEGRIVDEPEEPEPSLEESVRVDLTALPSAMRRGGVARGALMCARILDEGGLSPRDAAGFLREMRLALAQLREMAPGEIHGDVTDEVKMRREKRLAGELSCKRHTKRQALPGAAEH